MAGGFTPELEPAALDSIVRDASSGAKGHTVDTLSVRSIAISLKRIADSLEPNHVHADGGALNVRDLLSELVEQGRG